MTITNPGDLLQKLEELKASGKTHISVDEMSAYVHDVIRAQVARTVQQGHDEEQAAAADAASRVNAVIAAAGVSRSASSAIDERKRLLEQQLEMFKAVLESGLSALKSLSVINGAAAIALLAFLGNLIAKGSATDQAIARDVGVAMLSFSVGVLMAAAGLAFRYLGQNQYREHLRGRLSLDRAKADVTLARGNIYRGASVTSGAGALLMFALGILLAFLALRTA